MGPDQKVGPVSARMRASLYAFAPVLHDGVPLGLFAETSFRPRATVATIMRPLDESMLVSGDMSLGEPPLALVDEPFLFVLRGRRLTGFVTPADMGAVPARTHYYMQLSELEILLAQLVRQAFDDQNEVLDHLSETRRRSTVKLLCDLRRRDEVLDVVAALSLVGLVQIARQVPGFVPAATRGGRSWRWLTRGLGDFRNDVMHPVRDFARATQSGMIDLANFEERVRTFTDASRAVLDTVHANDGEPA
ncbi:MAG: hypothetical protein GC157_07910 [Frankiales bacterium]|nr:hypothetical protein [Frankiales bacterium]